MVNATLEHELHCHLEELRPDEQRQVMEFASALAKSRPRGVPGKDLLHFAGTISPEDLKLMSKAIEAGCGQDGLVAVSFKARRNYYEKST